ncbi:anthranilate 1,2-dioxygenase small subunit AndAd [Roseomonas populi]|uniref:Aromatic-ring-hydroxylating dioxygenase subunit beta n=1 Tax=Roseomonas populi TaxID=3121582 RepID=A0ABT1X1M3_9PROT|nr:anthranilate 1,2-dioxygenase small subunit AndAd [Roseomonas pecuniae]MCR0981998.1 aromatic-ring-hydroxylating dioxygenase subunit beta [Roseomonas pecuniae]
MREDLMLRLELMDLQDRYVAAIDNDRIEEWPGFFTEDCLYEIVSRENEEAGLPAPLIHCDSAGMLRDRVLSLRHANIYEKPAYRHMLSGMEWREEGEGYAVSTGYVVVNTSIEGESTIYQAGRYLDRVVRTEQGLRFREKRCIYDTLRVQTLLAFPI